jgi:hypothetical protein
MGTRVSAPVSNVVPAPDESRRPVELDQLSTGSALLACSCIANLELQAIFCCFPSRRALQVGRRSSLALSAPGAHRRHPMLPPVEMGPHRYGGPVSRRRANVIARSGAAWTAAQSRVAAWSAPRTACAAGKSTIASTSCFHYHTLRLAIPTRTGRTASACGAAAAAAAACARPADGARFRRDAEPRASKRVTISPRTCVLVRRLEVGRRTQHAASRAL